MLNLKIGEKNYKIKFGYEATLKTHLLSKVAHMSVDTGGTTEDDMSAIEDLLLFVPEFLLVGLQKYHKDEFGFDYDTKEGYDEQLDKAFDLIEEYCDSGSILTLFEDLQNELTSDGFLSGLMDQEVAKAEAVDKKIEAKQADKNSNN